MKTPLIALLFTFALCAFAHAGIGDPIPGTDVGLEHDPAGLKIPSTKTNTKGMFTFEDLMPGNYLLTLSFAKLSKQLSLMDKAYAANPSNYDIALALKTETSDDSIFDRWGNLLSTAPNPVLFTAKTGPLGIMIPGESTGPVSFAMLTGTLTYIKHVRPAVHLNGLTNITTKLAKYTLQGTVTGSASRLVVRHGLTGLKIPQATPTKPVLYIRTFQALVNLRMGKNVFSLQAAGTGGVSEKLVVIIVRK